MNINPGIVTALVSLTLAVGCSSHQDSTQEAQKINDEKIDNQAVAKDSDTKDKAKDVTESMVKLANFSLTEYELSKLALQKAVNPEVKAFAQQVMNDHQQGDHELHLLAKQMRVTLPDAITNRNQNRLGKLKGLSAGTDFDTQYLDEIANINGDALDAADNLRDNAPTDTLKTFARRVLDDDTKHKERAKQLKNVLD